MKTRTKKVGIAILFILLSFFVYNTYVQHEYAEKNLRRIEVITSEKKMLEAQFEHINKQLIDERTAAEQTREMYQQLLNACAR